MAIYVSVPCADTFRLDTLGDDEEVQFGTVKTPRFGKMFEVWSEATGFTELREGSLSVWKSQKGQKRRVELHRYHADSWCSAGHTKPSYITFVKAVSTDDIPDPVPPKE